MSILKVTSCFNITTGPLGIMTTTFQAAGRKKRAREKNDLSLCRYFPEIFILYFIGPGEEISLFFLFFQVGHNAQEEGGNGYCVSN